jgi:hypothetical protein
VADLPDLSAKYDELIKAIQAATASTTGPTAKYQSILDNLVTELGKPAYSDDQLAQLKTAAVDTLTHEHQVALDNKLRALGQQGIPPTSGLAQEALKNVDAQYQTLKADALQAQNVTQIEQINQRRQQLMQAASSSLTAAQQQAKNEQDSLIAQMNLLMNEQNQNIALRGQNMTAAQEKWNAELNQRAQEINLRGQNITTTGAGISLAQMAEQLSRNLRTEQNANWNQIVTLAGIPVELSAQRLNQALAVLGLGGSTSSKDILSALALIAKQAADANTTNNNASTDFWTTVGGLKFG